MSRSVPVAPRAGEISGVLRIGADPRDLAVRVKAGEVALIDRIDLDAASAQLLADRKPAAVINASPSLTGRFEAKGASVLAGMGVPLIDCIDRGILASTAGESVRIVPAVSGPCAVTITVGSRDFGGTEAGSDYVAERTQASAITGTMRLPVLAASALDLVQRDGPALVDPQLLPRIGVSVKDKDVLVVSAGHGYREQLSAIRRAAREMRMVIVSTGDAAAEAAKVRQVAVVVGPLDSAPDAVLTKAEAVVSHAEGASGGGGGMPARLTALGISAVMSESRLGPADLAVAIAAAGGARTIVTVGMAATVPELLEEDRGASTVLARLAAGGAWVDASTAARLYRTRASRVLTWLWWVLAVIALGGALALHPAVRDALNGVIDS